MRAMFMIVSLGYLLSMRMKWVAVVVVDTSSEGHCEEEYKGTRIQISDNTCEEELKSSVGEGKAGINWF